MPENDIFEEELDKATKQIKDESESSDGGESLSDQMVQMEDLISMDPSFAETKDYKDLVAKIEEESSGQARQEDEDEDQDEDEDEDEDEDDSVDDEDEDEDEDEEDPNDVFGVNKKGKKSKPVKINFEVPEEMSELLSSKYGIEDANKFFESADKWRNQAQEGVELAKSYEALSADVEALPPDIRRSISLWADGEDYVSAFVSDERLDFEATFENQDIDSLVQHYLPEQYDELVEELEEEDGITEEEFDKRVTLLARSTKKTFDTEKKALVKERDGLLVLQQNRSKALKDSALVSVENLSKAYPNFSKSELSKVRRILVEEQVDELFYNPDGSYTEEAAELVANAMYGGKMRDVIKSKAKNLGKSEANQEIVDSSPKKVRKRKASNDRKGKTPEAAEHLVPVFEKDPYA